MSSRTRRALLFWALAFTANALLGAAPPAASSAAPPASSSAASVREPAPTPAICGADIPNDASPTPSAGEWSNARAVRVNRGNAGPCTASVVREWLRLRCPTFLGGGLFAGDARGVSLTVQGDPFAASSGPDGAQNRAVTTVVLPLQRGRVRAVSFLQLVQGYNSASYGEAGMLSVVWRAGQPDPTLVMTQLPAPAQHF